MRIRWLAGTFAGILLSTGCVSLSRSLDDEASPAKIFTGDTVTVKEVVKGDELIVDKGGRTAHIRLLGVQAFYDTDGEEELAKFEAAVNKHLTDTVVGKQVALVLGKTPSDSHGRFLAYVEHDGRDVNQSLVAGGFTMVFTEYGFEREALYLAAENQAREKKAGVWGGSQSVKLITGLRKQWATFRAKRDESVPADPLLAAAAGDSATASTAPEGDK